MPMERALKIAAVCGRMKDELQALGFSTKQLVQMLLMDATAGAVATGIGKDDWLKMVADEHDACSRLHKGG